MQHAPLADVESADTITRLTGVDVRGFKFSVSNYAMQHALRQHGDAAREAARGQSAITTTDFGHLPMIVRAGRIGLPGAMPRNKGPQRLRLDAEVGNWSYTVIAQINARQRRIDVVTMWKR